MKEPLFYRLVRPLISLFVRIVYRPVMVGKENIPSKGRVVLAGNHTNNFDCLLLISATKRPIHFLAKDSLMKGWKKGIFQAMGIIPVDRSKKDPRALQSAIAYLEKGKVIGIFPEGTINRTEEVTMPFKFGAVKMSSDTKSPIVPFIIKGEYRPFKKGLSIEFLTPLEIGEDLEVENNRLREIVSKKLEG